MNVQLLARWLVELWQFSAMAAFLIGWLNIPILALFLGHRAAQLRDKYIDRRATLPTHAALHYYCAIHFGLVMPAWYFLTVRRQNSLAEKWWLGRGTNTNWTIMLGAICMGWLAWRLLEGVLSSRRPKFGGRVDRVVATAATGLCLWFLLKTGLALTERPGELGNSDILSFTNWFSAVAYPQSHYLGALLVYGLAAVEAWKKPAMTVETRARRRAAVMAVAVTLLIFLPFLLMIPKHSHRQAMAVLGTHRQELIEAAQAAELDPRLLSGIVYAIHRNHVPPLLDDLLAEMSRQQLRMGVISIKHATGPMRLSESRASMIIDVADAHAGFFFSGNAAKAMRIPTYLELSPQREILIPYQLKLRFRQAYGNSFSPRDQSDIIAGALMLVLLREQWRVAGYPIDDRPEILATLYQIGFENSHPKPDPKANKFGLRVKEFMESEACREWLEGAGSAQPDNATPGAKQ